MLVKRIKELCKTKGVSFIQFERESGLGVGTVARWDKNAPSINKVEQAAGYFGLTVSELLGEKEKPAAINGNGLAINPKYSDLSAEDRATVDALIERLATGGR